MQRRDWFILSAVALASCNLGTLIVRVQMPSDSGGACVRVTATDTTHTFRADAISDGGTLILGVSETSGILSPLTVTAEVFERACGQGTPLQTVKDTGRYGPDPLDLQIPPFKLDSGTADGGTLPVDAGTDAGALDGGVADAGQSDAGQTDAGAFDGGSDAGPLDAGFDAGPFDSGFPYAISNLPPGYVFSPTGPWSVMSPDGGDCELIVSTDTGRALQRVAQSYADCTGSVPTSSTLDSGTRLFVLNQLTVGDKARLRFVGSSAVIIVSTGDVTIDGDIHARSYGGASAPGAPNPLCGAARPNSIEEGGGGGGFGTVGGNGGVAMNRPPVDGGGIFDAGLLQPLVAGCDGVGGGFNAQGGGRAGGAIQISARDTLSVRTPEFGIYVFGLGGQGGVGNSNVRGAGGGGSGGSILLEAKVLLIAGDLIANGGGGGEGGNQSNGKDGGYSETDAPALGNGNGGDGAASRPDRTVIQAQPGGQAGGRGGGGGGGGLGRIHLSATQSCSIANARISGVLSWRGVTCQ